MSSLFDPCQFQLNPDRKKVLLDYLVSKVKEIGQVEAVDSEVSLDTMLGEEKVKVLLDSLSSRLTYSKDVSIFDLLVQLGVETDDAVE